MNTTTIEFNPALFHLSDSKKGFLSDANKVILKKITGSIKNKKQLFLVIGEKGSGKSTLVQRAIGDLKSKLLFINLSGEDLNFEALIDHTGNHLKDGFPTDSALDVKSAHLKVLIKTKSIKYVIFLINQSLTEQRVTLESAIKLVNSNFFNGCSSHLIITGQPDLESKLKSSNLLMSQVNSFHINPLSKDDTNAYINFHLNRIDQGSKLFSTAAIQRIIRYAKGRPRLINRLCEQGMMMANIEEASSVTEDMINEVLENSVFLNNEFDYEGAELEPSEPAPFLNSFNQAAVSAQPTKKSPELLDDFFSQLNSNPNPSPVVPLTPPRKTTVDKKPVKAKPKLKAKRSRQDQSTPKQQQPKVTRVAKPHSPDVRPVNRTKDGQKEERKPAVVSIFAMGMVTSAMIGSAWYYFDQQSPNLLENNVATVGSTELMLPEEKQEVNNTPNRLQTKRSVIEEKEKLEFEPKPKEKEIYPQIVVVKKVERSTIIQNEKQIQSVKKEKIVDNVIEPVQEKIQPEPVHVVVAQIEAKPIAIEEDKVATTTKSIFTQELTEQQLIKRAKQQVINKQLMSPENNNAWSTYEKVLKLNPNNTQAQEGIYQIKEVYMGWAREKINEGNDIHALHYLNKASKISPNDPDILEAFSKIKRTAIEKSKSFNPQLDTRLYRLLNKPEGIPELLAFASEQIVEKNLTKPISNSAYSIYRLILNRFPDHAQALAGVKKIRGRYISWAKYEIKHGKLSHAEYLYTKALEVSPSDPEILSDLDQLRQTTKPL